MSDASFLFLKYLEPLPATTTASAAVRVSSDAALPLVNASSVFDLVSNSALMRFAETVSLACCACITMVSVDEDEGEDEESGSGGGEEEDEDDEVVTSAVTGTLDSSL